MRSILIVGDFEEERIEYFAESGEVIVVGLPTDGLECSGRGGEEVGDFFRGHRGLR